MAQTLAKRYMHVCALCIYAFEAVNIERNTGPRTLSTCLRMIRLIEVTHA